MSIQYKTRNEREFHFINIPESYISVLELKKRLIEKEKIRMKGDFSFKLFDEKGMKGLVYGYTFIIRVQRWR